MNRMAAEARAHASISSAAGPSAVHAAAGSSAQPKDRSKAQFDRESDTTAGSSSDRESDDDEDIEEGGVAYEAQVDELEQYLVKPMTSMLQVCPMDDLVLEDEKRRRRSTGNELNNRRHHCADAESLPTAPSPLIPIAQPRRRDFLAGAPRSAPSSASGAFASSSPPPQLRRDSMAIRQQYWTQLGFSVSRRDLERTTGRKKERREGLKVRLNDAARFNKGESKNLFHFLTNWYGSDREKQQQHDSATAETSASSPRKKKGIQFNEEAELFYIPLHSEYSKRQRDGMWHSRVEFISMVERNLDAVYEEMEREYEEQLQNEFEENEAMAAEEARQREVEAAMQVIEADRVQAEAKAKAAAKAAASGRPASLKIRNPPPSLSLHPTDTQIKLSPRARSPHDIRFKYLKHLGINS